MSARFYVNFPLSPGPFTLDGAEARHLASASRLRPGDQISLFNGNGNEYPARIVEVTRREVTVDILGAASPSRELAFTLEVASPMPKGDRAQFLIEKLTELGVSTFVPLICHFSNTHPRDTKAEKLGRWVIEASKQCGRNVLMNVESPTEWATYCTRGVPGELRVLAHPDGAALPSAGGASAADSMESGPVRIAVGPEGGFTDDEVALAVEQGWRSIGLGPRILRVETAAIVLATRFAI